MTILFEGYSYRSDILAECKLPADMWTWLSDGNSAKTTYVGYYNSVFILPKVFIDGQGRPFGKDNVTIEDFVNTGKTLSELLGETDAQTVSRLSFWIYLAIARYAEKVQDTCILKSGDIQNVKSIGEYGCTTFIEVIQSLRKFNSDHQHLFTYIVKSNRSGKNKIDWTRTVGRTSPVMQDDEPVYLSFYNKQKKINYDEEIIVIFYSVLQYLKEKYFFEEQLNLNFNLIPVHKIEEMIEDESGTLLLNKIRHKYFTDDLVQLWHLLYVFFEKAEKIANKGYIDEFVLARSFNNVFEHMVDQLIGSKKLARLKKNKDNKIIDHLYIDESLLRNGKTYFIADSKYYKEDRELEDASIYKQFTYARNMLQYNLDEKHKGRKHHESMRDEFLEGYSIIPNFFIRGSVLDSAGIYNYEDEKIEFDTKACDSRFTNIHFTNRLFDRDTIILHNFKINFLYVLAKYVEGEDKAAKERIRRKFRTEMIRRYDGMYHFYRLTPLNGKTTEDIIDLNFRSLIGRAIRPYKDSGDLIFAWEKNAAQEDCVEYLKALRHIEYKEFTLAELNGLV